MVAKKRLPSLGRRSPPPNHVLGNRRLPDIDAKLEQFPVDPWSAPEWVGKADIANQQPNVRRHLRTTAMRFRLPSPIQTETRAVPTDMGKTSADCANSEQSAWAYYLGWDWRLKPRACSSTAPRTISVSDLRIRPAVCSVRADPWGRIRKKHSAANKAANPARVVIAINNNSSTEATGIIPSITTSDFSVNEGRTSVNAGISLEVLLANNL